MTAFLDFANGATTLNMYEVHGTRQVAYANNGGSLPTGKVRVAVKSGDADLAKRALLSGYTTVSPGIPAKWPYFNAIGFMYCIQVLDSVDGGYFQVEETEKMRYTWHFLDLSYAQRLGVYKLRSPSIGGALYFEDHWEPRTELRRTSNIELVWVSGGRADLPVMPDEAPSISMNSAILTHTISGLRFINQDWYKLVNTLAEQAYLSDNLQKSFAAKTLMLEHFSVVQEFSQNSYLPIPAEITFTIICRYGIKDHWNLFYRNDGTTAAIDDLAFYAMLNSKTNKRIYPYPEKDHTELLSP